MKSKKIIIHDHGICPFCKSNGLEKGYYKRYFLKIPIVCKKCGKVSRELCYSK